MRAVSGIPTEQPTFPDVFKDSNRQGPGQEDFKDRMTLGSGADQIDLHYFGRGHTNGDAWVVFPALRMMHAGDIFSGKNLPLLDANNGGSGVAIGDTLAKAARQRQERDTIITGHSTHDDGERPRRVRAVQPRFRRPCRRARRRGRPPTRLRQSWKMPEKYAGYAAPQPARLKTNVEIVFDETK